MPLVNAADRLVGPVFICLQELTGLFPVTKDVFSASNVIVTCSISGKLNKSLMEY
jgi:hypothetical protein